MAGLAVAVLMIAGVTALAWLTTTTTASPDAAGPPRNFACAITGPSNEDPAKAAARQEHELEICRRQADDDTRRAPRSYADPESDSTDLRVLAAMSAAVCETRCGDETRPATRSDVELARTVLTAQGFADAEVRMYRPGDPAPDGSVVYAVRLPGDVCLVGFNEMGAVPRVHAPVGMLPGGRCLAV